MITDDDIIKIFFPNNKNFSKKGLTKIDENDEIYQYLINRYDDSLSIEETIKRIRLNISKHPVCQYCGKPLKYLGSPNKLFQEKYCSQTCLHNDEKHWEKCANTCLNKYGDKNYRNITKAKETSLMNWGFINPCKSDIIKEKSKNTRIKKYGKFFSDEVIQQLHSRKMSDEQKQRIKQTKLKKYGDENYTNVDKIKQTKLERYGNENYNNINKIKQTKLERYGDENFTNINKRIQTYNIKYGGNSPTCNNLIKEKIKNTVKIRYGVNHIFNLPEIRKLSSEKAKSEESKNKLKKTRLERYGDENFTNRNKAAETCLKRYGVSNKRKLAESKEHMSKVMKSEYVQAKRNKTLKENNSYRKSIQEENCFYLLYNKYPDIIRQYHSKEYPFNCDFYIPSLDLYIEYQGSHYHHFHPFNENNINDIKELNRLKQIEIEELKTKKKSQYTKIIYTWTDLDIRKRKIVNQNNLNFIEFWNLDDVKKWLN